MKKKFKVCTSGKTVDGREIKGEWLKQMADSYDPKLYGARINCEHMIGLKARGDFPALGDVVALSAETEGNETALYAELDPTDDLIQLVADRQKVYTSVEINADFRDTDKAYLMGLAVTDSPAAVGTDMLSFARDHGVGNKFSQALECDMSELSVDKPSASILETVKGLFSKKQAMDSEEFFDHSQAIELIATKCDEALSANQKLRAEFVELKQQKDALQEKLTQAEAHLNQVDKLLEAPDPNYTSRPAASGETELPNC